MRPRHALALVLSALVVAGSLIAPVAAPEVALAAPIPGIADSPVGTVRDVAIGPDGTAYTVGDFAAVGAATGALANLSQSAGLVDRTWPIVDGRIETMVSDGAGGWFIGGTIYSAGGLPRTGMAHVLADGTVDPTWAPVLNAGGVVNKMLRVGTTLYLGGLFSTVNGTSRTYAAAVRTDDTGSLLAWNPSPNSGVKAIAVDDSVIYLGGSFSTIGGTPRAYLAAVDPTTGALDDWYRAANGAVESLLVDDSTIYVGGSFTTLGGETRNRLATLRTADVDDSTITSWNPNIGNGSVYSLTLDDSGLYVGGSFTSVGGLTRNRLAIVNTEDTGTVGAWDPNFSNTVWSIVLTPTQVIAGGQFTTVGGSTSRQGLAIVDRVTGAPTAWDPALKSTGVMLVIVLQKVGDRIYAAGSFTHANTVSRTNAAAFDSDQRVTAWNPSLNSSGLTVTLHGSRAYIGGSFNAVGGVSRAGAAAVRIDDTGSLTNWDLGMTTASVYDIATDGTRAYVVGSFISVKSGTTRRGAAAFLLDDTATLDPWNPSLSAFNYARTVVLDDTLAYLGGNFTTVGGVSRNRLAAVRTDDTGSLTAWNPNVGGGDVWSIALDGDRAYVVGALTTVGGVSRNRAAAVRTDDTGSLTTWNPNITCASSPCSGEGTGVRTILLDGSRAYLGGNFENVNGVTGFSSLAAVRTDDTGTYVSSWVPTMRATNWPAVNYLSVGDEAIIVGGNYLTPRLSSLAYPSSLSVLPGVVSAPAAPTAVTGTAGDGQASISWTAGSTGGSPITRVDFALDDTVTVDDSTSSVASPHVLTGLANGTTYTVYVRLVNAVGAGPWSVASAPFTPTAVSPPPVPAPTPASAPSNVRAVAGDASAAVFWSAPESSGSYPVSAYQVTSSPGGRACLTSSLTCSVTGLTNGTAYTFTVRALTGAGWSAASEASAAVTPSASVKPSVVITGTREGDRISISGRATGFGMGAELRPWLRFPGQAAYSEGSATILVSMDGTFEWGRRTSKKVSVYVQTPDGSVRSNAVTIRVR